uniref:basic salivary proline-rich protein 2-like n=1 Tax=Podarcis muralis TaxID=64176 RepID=UPI00109FFA42|nr:basic salivary proline-rich protein 2-like [Podarcis muralis]
MSCKYLPGSEPPEAKRALFILFPSQAAALAGKAYYNRRETDEALGVKGREGNTADGGISEVQERELIRAQIRELRSQQRQEAKPADMPDSSTPAGTLLLLDPVAGQAPAEPPSLSESGPDPESSAEASSRDSDSRTESPPASEEETGTGRISAPEDSEGLTAPEGGSAASEPPQGQPAAPSAVSDSSQEEEASLKLPSEETPRELDAPQAPEQEAGVVDSRESVSSAAPSSAAPRPLPLQMPAAVKPHNRRHARQPAQFPPGSTGSRDLALCWTAHESSAQIPQAGWLCRHPPEGGECGQRCPDPAATATAPEPPAWQETYLSGHGVAAVALPAVPSRMPAGSGVQRSSSRPKPSAIQPKTGTVRPPAESPAGPKEASRPPGAEPGWPMAGEQVGTCPPLC